MYRKEKRASLTEEKCSDLYEKATKTVHRKYNTISLSLTDESKLDDTYNLEMLVRKTRQWHTSYDMHDVFTIVILKEDDDEKKTVIEVKNLYEDYANITEEEVAASNQWYRTQASVKTYVENLRLTYMFLQNNVEDAL